MKVSLCGPVILVWDQVLWCSPVYGKEFRTGIGRTWICEVPLPWLMVCEVRLWTIREDNGDDATGAGPSLFTFFVCLLPCCPGSITAQSHHV